MFNAMIVAVLLALTTWYCAGQGDPGVLAARTAQRGQASAMAQYRQTVVGYFTVHPEQFQAAPVNRAGFANYRLADGTILVYALAPQPGLTAELLALSQRSHMVGRFSDGFFRPALGAAPSSIATPALAIPDGGPVWLAAAN
ncbi:hypothetical protein [Massilia sp. CCM 8734]|uniref:hypothetical protein n=1 Tax=Massilia sp. CCM 8734 TaxID=2609283 RepID=UPI00141F378D|nr:hypothetical protein [Massilia sp. CCM 8734]NHZ94504.1 hypothetical protein [Massilia sp. CCM 8734]